MRNKFLLPMLCGALIALAMAKGGPQPDIPVTDQINDFDGNGNAFAVQSDLLGAYQNGVSGVQAILQGTANFAWLLNTYNSGFTASAGRSGYITLSTANQESMTATLPTIWSTWGKHLEPIRIITHGVSCDLVAIRPGSPIYCPLLIRFGTLTPSGKSSYYYRLEMTHGLLSDPESQEVQISCNTSNSSGQCIDWFVDSIPPVDQNAGVSTNQVIAQLSRVTTSGAIVTPQGDFYLTFHIHVTNP